MERGPVDGGDQVAGGLHVVTGDQIHVEPLVSAFHVGVFRVLLVAVREDGVADGEPVLL